MNWYSSHNTRQYEVSFTNNEYLADNFGSVEAGWSAESNRYMLAIFIHIQYCQMWVCKNVLAVFNRSLSLSPHRQKRAEATIINITEKEIWQECTGSPLLFALAVRVTAEKIRSDTISREIKWSKSDWWWNWSLIKFVHPSISKKKRNYFYLIRIAILDLKRMSPHLIHYPFPAHSSFFSPFKLLNVPPQKQIETLTDARPAASTP